MYELGDAVQTDAVDPGTNLLVSGPPMGGKETVAYRILAHGLERDEGVVIVSTTDSAEKTIQSLADVAGTVDTLPVGVVDCVTQQQGAETTDTRQIKYASSPVDMTGIGIQLSELLEEFYERQGLQNNRVLLQSISTLLMYSDLQTVFRFLHVFTGRIASVDGLGLYTIDPTTHDEQEMNTLKQLFDGVITVEDGADDQQVTIRGL